MKKNTTFTLKSKLIEMNQRKIQEIIDLENKFLQLSQSGNPNVVDNGFFLDAVFNVTSELKKKYKLALTGMESEKNSYNSDLQVICDLYNSLKGFESLYTSCLKK